MGVIIYLSMAVLRLFSLPKSELQLIAITLLLSNIDIIMLNKATHTRYCRQVNVNCLICK